MIDGGAGADLIATETGNDRIDGGAGNDEISPAPATTASTPARDAIWWRPERATTRSTRATVNAM